MEEEQQTSEDISPEDKVKELTAQGTQCLDIGQTRDALIHFQAALSLTETIDRPKLKLSCLLNTGAALVTTGEHQRGISLLQSALSLLDSIPNHDKKTTEEGNEDETPKDDSKHNNWSPDYIRGDIYYNLGLANEGMGENSLAVTQLKQAVDYYIKAKQPSIAGDVLYTLSSCFKTHRDYKQQVTALLTAQQLYNESCDPNKEIACFTELAIAYHAMGKREECLQMLTTAKIMGLRLDNAKAQGMYIYVYIGG